LRHILNRSGLIVQLAVLGLFVTTTATFGWAIVRTGHFVVDLIDGGLADDQLLVTLLEVIDTYVIATVQLIFVIGLYELFVDDLDVPAWLEVHSLDDLKKSLIDALIVVLAVKGIEKLVAAKAPLDALYYAAAVGLLVVAFTWFRSLKSGAKPPSVAALPRPSCDDLPVSPTGAETGPA
jgi:uncharacterized membrane protein YqhA